MSSASIATPPSVSWAQQSARIFVTFNVECAKPDIKIEKKTLLFKGICAPDNKLHEVEIPLFAEVDPESSTQVNKGRYIEVVLAKEKADGPMWPTFTSDNKKHHWLKVDFERWQDEEDSDHDADDMFSSRIGDFGDENDKEVTGSSDEEDLPDLE